MEGPYGLCDAGVIAMVRAAFFDLDKTILDTSSNVALSGPFMQTVNVVLAHQVQRLNDSGIWRDGHQVG